MANVLIDVFGRGNTMKVLDYLLDITEVDVSIKDIMEGTNLSRKTVDTIIEQLSKSDLVKMNRKIGKTKMYIINREDPVVAKLLDINDIVIKKQESLIVASSSS